MHQSFTRLSLALLLIGSVPLLAQSGSQPAGQQPPPTTQQPPSATAQAGETMLTGCLRSQAAAAATADTKGNVYTLEVLPAAGVAAGAAAGATAGAGAAASKMTYTLSAAESVGLAKHVDHQVQLTGKMQPPSSGSAAAGTTPSAGAKPEPGGAHRTFQVTALKMISAKCP